MRDLPLPNQVYLQGDVIQPTGYRKPGSQWVHADVTTARLAELLREYERVEGQCSAFSIRIVK